VASQVAQANDVSKPGFSGYLQKVQCYSIYYIKLQARNDLAVSSFCMIQLALSEVGFRLQFL